MKKNPKSNLMVASGEFHLWDQIANRALEKDILDKLDLALIQTLAQRIHGSQDLAFQITLACLLATLQTGGLRISYEGPGLVHSLKLFITKLELDNDSPLHLEPTLEAGQLAEAFTRQRLMGNYAAIMGNPPHFLPLLISGTGLYFQKHQNAEAILISKIAGLLRAPDRTIPETSYCNVLDTVLDYFPLYLKSQALPMIFDPKQKAALALALKKKLTIISGGPGTGKTSLTTNLLRSWVRTWMAAQVQSGKSIPESAFPRIRLAAPTGRAAQRMAESIQTSIESIRYAQLDPLSLNKLAPQPAFDLTSEKKVDQFVAQLPCETLHALLRYNPGSGEYFHQSSRPLPADLVILDEVSMVDIFALSRLVNALEEEAYLVLVGDGDQLPSVESGSVLADLMLNTDKIDHPLAQNIAILDQSHRSEARILKLAHQVNTQDTDIALASILPAVLGFDNQVHEVGCQLIYPKTLESIPPDFRAGWRETLQAWVDTQYFNLTNYSELIAKLGYVQSLEDPDFQSALAQIFAHLEKARILTFTRKGWHGCITVNAQIRERLSKVWDPKAGPTGTSGFHGAPILILENDYSKGLFNGDVGVCLRIQGRPMGLFRRGNSFLSFPTPFLPKHETAFAMTIHKSQGSEYDRVLLLLPESGNRLLSKEILYTAITRARTSIAIYGPKEVFLEALNRKVFRESGIAESLKSLFGVL